MKILAINVPSSFFVGEYFELEPSEINALLVPYRGHIDTGQVELTLPNIEKTIKHHTGDNRLWYEDGYITFYASKIFMAVEYNEWYHDIFDYIQAKIPSLHAKYHKYR